MALGPVLAGPCQWRHRRVVRVVPIVLHAPLDNRSGAVALGEVSESCAPVCPYACLRITECAPDMHFAPS